ncbi:MAG TPA: protein phosphatase 2C domain-containing protein [Rugosimonospora sp.]|nr:protein phosphatase 2C domain-containing protein [Rugosimonospora sp.]
MTISIEAAGRTHVGLVRRCNEDSFYMGQSLYAVADGLGGHVAGDVASKTVIEALRLHDGYVDPSDLVAVLGAAVNQANRALRDRIKAQPELAGMGTTLVAVLCSGTAAVLANVGDSRVYLLRERGAHSAATVQITEDHTFLHLVADAANIPDLPGKLARFLDGRADGRSPDLSPRELTVGDRFLLCSDGLSSYVPHDQIHAALTSTSTADMAADRLVALALEHGGPDNVTVIVLDVHEYQEQR